jgi:hypothetical protein
MDDESLSLLAVCLIRQFSAANHHRLKCELIVLRESRSRGSFPLGRMTQVHVSASIGTRVAYILIITTVTNCTLLPVLRGGISLLRRSTNLASAILVALLRRAFKQRRNKHLTHFTTT